MKDSEKTFIVSSKIQYSDYASMPDIAGKMHWKVDMQGEAFSDLSLDKFKLSAREVNLPVSEVYTTEKEIDSEKLNEGCVSTIQNLYLYKGKHIVQGTDLVNYLFMSDSGSEEIFVENLWTLEE